MPKDAVEQEDIDLPAYSALWLCGSGSTFSRGKFIWANWDMGELLDLEEKVCRERAFLTVGLVM